MKYKTMEQILKDIYIIKVPLPGNPLKNLNSYYIKGKQRNLLIDTGFNCEACYAALKSGLDELNADMDNTDIFLTHVHSDHSGLCKRAASENTKVYLSETDKKYMDRFHEDTYPDYRHARYLVLGFSKAELEENLKGNPMRAYIPPADTKYETIDDGFGIDLGNYYFKTVATPGHTPGHMCLYDGDHKIFFSGDHIIFDITPNITSWEGFENPLRQYIESLKKTKRLDAGITLSAHRSAMGSCGERIDELIKHHMERADEAYRIVESFPGATTYEIASRMKWSIQAKNWGVFPLTQKWFAVGEASAHLEYLLAQGLILRENKNGKLIYNIK